MATKKKLSPGMKVLVEENEKLKSFLEDLTRPVNTCEAQQIERTQSEASKITEQLENLQSEVSRLRHDKDYHAAESYRAKEALNAAVLKHAELTTLLVKTTAVPLVVG